ncbi:MAG: hypothetical protein E6J91_09455 [Deltaproteobacteria bacterium]|nr:MAG: hypothetical protein E6J91_09455 [Deltaproteobacteria bacterium]
MARELTAIALAMACACGRSDPPSATPPEAKPLAGKAFYRVDAAPAAACAHGAICEAHLVLTALGTYHVNKDYPFKFVADAAATPVDGEGRFALGDARHGTLTVTFTPAAQGPARLVGTFKLSVCNDDTCEIETPRIELAVPVS